ncbi:hypothetical protein D3C84_615150 [compost metagenome]
MEVSGALHHLAQVAGLFAGAEHAQRHRRRQAVFLQGAGQCLAFADARGGLVQACARGGAEQAADHADGGEYRNPALQQDAQGAIEARQLVDLDALADRRQSLDLAPQGAAYAFLAQQRHRKQQGQGGAAEYLGLMRMEEQPAVQQYLGQPGQVGAKPLEHQAETRHHVAHQEQQHPAAHHEQQDRVDRGADDLLPHLVHPAAVGHVAAQGIADRPGLLAGLHQRHIERGEHRGELRQRLGQRLALVEQSHQAGQQLARLRIGLLLGQAFQRVDQCQAGIQQGRQLLAEQQQGKGLAPPPAPQRPPPLGLQGEYPQALGLGLAAGLVLAGGLDHQGDHSGPGAQRFYLVAHGGHCQLVTSAFSPSPPGWPSLPMLSRSKSPLSPGER